MDRQLVEAAQRGDRHAYEALARASVRRLYLIAYRIVRDPDRAEDAAQLALVTIWQELPSLRDPDRFESWTYRLVVRACLGETRRQRRAGVRHVAIDEVMPVSGDAIAEVDRRDELERALRELSLEHRTVIVLHHYAGIPLGEIAEILEVPYGTVGSRLHHAMRALRAGFDAGERSPLTEGQPA